MEGIALRVFLLLWSSAIVSANGCGPGGKVVFCYYSSWSVYRPGLGNYTTDDIDPNLCTHAVYAFAGLSIEGTTFALDAVNDLPELGGKGQYYEFRQLRERNPCLKIMLSIGGWDEGSEKYSLMAETDESRAKFVDHLLRYLVYYGFDGVDLDWEYPGARGGIAADRENYVKLLAEMKKRLSARGKFLCVAVGAAADHVLGGYDVARISEQVDYVLLMAYDYHRGDVTSHVAPWRKRDGDVNEGSVQDSALLWINNGCPQEKLVIGILTSGRSFTLKNATVNGLGAPIEGPGAAGNFTNIDGFISYYEICLKLLEPGWKKVTDEVYSNNYMTKGDQWITYEDVETARNKTSNVKSMELAGVMIWSVDTDDFRGLCDRNRNGILRAVWETLAT